jgi:hypothetical protein
LGLAEVSEEVADLLWGERIEDAWRHEAVAGGGERSDFAAAQGDFGSVEAAEGDGGGILVGEESADGASVRGGDDDIFEALADLGIGVDDADEEGAEVIALVGSEVWSDVAALMEESVAGTAE